MRFRRRGQLLIVAAATEILTGLSYYLFPGDFHTPGALPLRPLFPLLSILLVLGGVLSLALARYALTPWLGRCLALGAAAPLLLVLLLSDGHGLQALPLVYGPLALAVGFAPWTKDFGKRRFAAWEGAQWEYALATLAIVELGVGTLLLLPVGAGGLVPALSPWRDALGLLGLVGAAALVVPGSAAAWSACWGRWRRLVAAGLPAVLLANAVASGRWSSVVAYACWFIPLLGAVWLSVRLAVTDSGEDTRDRLERLLEGWGWLLVVVAVTLTLLSGSGAVASEGTLHAFVLGIVTYNVLAFLVLPRWGRPETRVFVHLAFLTVAIAFLTADDGWISRGFLVLLVVGPLLALRTLGPAAGWRLLLLTIGLVALGDMKTFFTGQDPFVVDLTEALSDAVVLLAAVLVVARDVNSARLAEQRLREDEARFRAVTASAPHAIVVTDGEDRIRYWNEAAGQIFGYSQAEAVGQPQSMLVPPDRRAGYETLLLGLRERAGTEGDHGVLARAVELTGRRRDGETFPLEFSASTWRTRGERFFTAFMRDVSERRRASAELARLRRRSEAILGAAGDGICGMDKEGRTTFANPAALRLTGYSSEEMIGQLQHALIHHAHPDGSPYAIEDCPIHQSLRDGQTRRVADEVLWRRDGDSFPAEYVSTPIWEDGEIVGGVLAFMDISHRRAVERMKNEFISIVSHELRTPLTSIRGSLGLLAAGVGGELGDQGRRMVEIAVNNTDRLVRLINDILDVERMESGRVSLQPQVCDAATLMAQVIEELRPVAQRAGVMLRVEPAPERIWADPDRIAQTLTNLVANAIKFSPPGGIVRLTAERQGQELRFDLSDQGRGIPADKLEAVFERFLQVDASDSREKGGTGLGLAICRAIVVQHGGQIWAESELGRGSTFRFTLPLATEEPPAEQAPPGSGVESGPLVLVCDDDASVRDVVALLLVEHGYRVATASCGEQVLERAGRLRPAVILLDLVLPGMSGCEVAARLKGQAETRDIPILVLSGLQPDGAHPALADAAAWMTKPFDEQALVSAVQAVSAPGRRVLIVEDDPDLARVLTESFERQGVQALHARSGAEAIRSSQRFCPDLLLLDVVLPDGDGYAVVDWLRQHDRLSHVPLVVYSAGDLDEAARERLRLGETRFVTKGRADPGQVAGQIVGLLRRMLPEGGRGGGGAARASG